MRVGGTEPFRKPKDEVPVPDGQGDTPAEPQIFVSGLDSADPDAESDLILSVTGGSITFADGGASGHMTAEWLDYGGKEKVTSDVTWSDCGSAD